MLKSIVTRFALTVTIIIPAISFSQDTTDVSWGEGTPGTLEAAITGPGVYRLEAGKVYLTVEHIPVETGAIHIVGATPADGVHPATIQPYVNAEGVLGHSNGELFTVVGDNAELALKGLILNGASFGGEGSLHGCASARGAMNKVIVENCVISHIAHLAFFTMGTKTDFHITNNVIKSFTNGPGGMFYGGVVWGAGSWMGTIGKLEARNNTIDGVIGEAFVIYERVDHGSVIDHNTFTNIVMNCVWYRGQNNLSVTNNLFYNTKSYGQSTYDASGWGVWYPGGVGQMSVRPADTVDYWMSDGQFVNMHDRNIHYGNNAFAWSDAMVDWVNTLSAAPWSWEVTTVTVDTTTGDTTTVVTTQWDTMLTVAQQAIWIDDTTLTTIAQNTGVTQDNNAGVTDLGMNLDEAYITHQLARTLDFRDDQTTQGVGANNQWMYEHDDSYTNIEWPMYYDASYSSSSVAATHCTHGGPVGATRWMDHAESLDTDNSINLPKAFALKQNYPNPFNPSTDIVFDLEKSSTINLTVFNVLGQKVKVLANGSKQAGTHTVNWDGRDEMGATVSTGLYFYTLTDGNNSVTKKMALMK